MPVAQTPTTTYHTFSDYKSMSGDEPQDIEMPAAHGSAKISFAKAPPMFDGNDKAKWGTFTDALFLFCSCRV
jgi:hypothetical protein